MEVGEAVAVAAWTSDDECMFPHCPVTKRENDLGNDSSALSSNLAGASAAGEELYISHLQYSSIPDGTAVTYNAHHLLPGNASWPKAKKLLKWVDAGKGHIKSDIGYDVNCFENGIDLPSNNAMRGSWTGKSITFKSDYAFAAMDADGPTRQFHDSHGPYSKKVVEILEKIAAKLDGIKARDMGCGEDDCLAGKKKPFAPPLHLVGRINAASAVLAKYLWGNPVKWVLPLYTSKFALMYKDRTLTEKAAQAALKGA